MEELRKNPRALMAIGGLILVVIILAIMALGGITINKENTDDSNKEEIVKLTVAEIDLGAEKDIKLQDMLAEYIDSGVSGVYTIGNRHFVVLTSGENNYSNIEYEVSSDPNGNDTIRWWFSTITSDETHGISYKVLEVNKENIQIIKSNKTFDESTLNGYCEVIVYKYNDKNTIFSTKHQQSLSIETLNTPGTYMADFIDGKLNSLTKIESVTLKDCVIIDKVAQTSRLYRVQIGDNIILDINIDKLNIDTGTTYNIKVSYDSTLGVFKGEILGGIA